MKSISLKKTALTMLAALLFTAAASAAALSGTATHI